MGREIINKVANSGLITIDLADYISQKPIEEFDLKAFLFKDCLLKEKMFRTALKEFDFSKYQNKVAAVFCSSDAIIPMWSYMLVSSYLSQVCSHIHFGRKEEVFQQLILKNINSINADAFNNKKVIIKGCGNIPLSESLYMAITQKLQSSVASLMFGEACSAVPVYKKKNES